MYVAGGAVVQDLRGGLAIISGPLVVVFLAPPAAIFSSFCLLCIKSA